MKNINKRLSLSIVNHIPMILFFVVLFSAGTFSCIGFFKNSIFLLIQFLIVYLPGYFIYSILMYQNHQVVNNRTKCFVSYIVGYCSFILIYVFIILFNVQKYIGVITIVYFLALLIAKKIVVKTRDAEENSSVYEIAFISVLLLCAFLMVFFVFHLNNLSAEITGYLRMHRDNVFWFRNCVSATKGYPLPNISVEGYDFYYHYFSSLNIAYLHGLTGIEIFDLAFVYNEYVIVFMLLGAVYSLMSVEKSKLFCVCTAIVILLFSTPKIDQTIIAYYIAHIYVTSFGLAESLAISMIAVYLFYIMIVKNKRVTIGGYIVALVVFCVAVGLKGPVGLVALSGILSCSAVLLISKEKRTIAFISILSYCIVFGITMVVFIKGLDVMGLISNSVTSDRVVSFPTLTNITDYVNSNTVFIGLREKTNGILAYGLASLCYLFQSAFIINCLIIMMIIGCIIAFRDRKHFCNISKDKKYFLFTCFIAYCFGLLMCLLTFQSGGSQVYFLFAAYSFGTVFVMQLFSVCLNSKGIITLLKRCSIMVTVILVVIGLLETWKFVESYVESSLQIVNKSTDQEQVLTDNSITMEELEALRWARDNIEDDEILISNRVLYYSPGIYEPSRTCVTSAYSEHQVYLESYSTDGIQENDIEERLNDITGLFNDDVVSKEKIIDKGIHYVIVFKNIPDSKMVNGYCVYENSDVAIIDLCIES